MAKINFGNISSSIGSAMSGVASSVGSSASNKNNGSSSSSSRPSSSGSSGSSSGSSSTGGIAGSIASAIKDKLNSGSSSGSSGGKYVNVAPGGNAPAGTQIGDIVITAGGNYKVVSPGTSGATYNPSSGLWSIKVSGTGNGASGGSSGYDPMGSYFDSGLSQRDKTAIESLQMAWEEAMAKGDTVGASQYHQWAEDIREKYGYSGGADGSMYIPIELEEDKLPNVGLPVYEPQTE